MFVYIQSNRCNIPCAETHMYKYMRMYTYAYNLDTSRCGHSHPALACCHFMREARVNIVTYAYTFTCTFAFLYTDMPMCIPLIGQVLQKDLRIRIRMHIHVRRHRCNRSSNSCAYAYAYRHIHTYTLHICMCIPLFALSFM